MEFCAETVVLEGEGERQRGEKSSRESKEAIVVRMSSWTWKMYGNSKFT